MKQSHLRLLTRRFWAFLLGSIIAFAVLVQIARQAFLLVNDYRDVLEASLSEQLGVVLEIGSINASWHGLRFEVELTDVDIFSQSGDEVFKIGIAQAELSLIDSVIQRGMAWRTITFEEFKTSLVQGVDHGWQIKGYDGGTANTENPFIFDDPLDIFLFGRRVEIRSATLLFEFESGASTELTIPTISLENDRFFHRMNAAISVDGKNTLNFVVEGYGDPRNKQNFSSSGYLEVKSIALLDVANAVLEDEKVERVLPYIEHALLDFQFWFKGAPQTGMTASGAISIDGFSNEEKAHGFDLPERIESSITGLWNTTFGWQFALNKPQLSWSDKDISFSDIGFFGQAGRTGLRISELSVEDVISVVNSSLKEQDSGLRSVLSQLKPSGLLQDVEVQLTRPEDGYFLARANLLVGSSGAFKGSPALSNINGYLETSLFGGYVDVDTGDGFSLDLTKVFKEPIVVDQARGQVAWRVDLENKKAFLESSQIYGKQNDKQVLGAFALELPFSRKVGEEKLSLLINVDAADVLEYKSYLPRNVPSSLTAWLNEAVIDGHATNISVLYHGSASRNPSVRPSYQVSANFDELELNFDKNWPELHNASGQFLLDSNKVSAVVESGHSLNNTLSVAVIDTVAFGEKSGLSIRADLIGSASDAQNYLLSSPVKSSLEGFLADWQLEGTYHANVALDIPFSFDKEDIDFRVDATLTDNDIHMQKFDLRLNQIDGQIQYSKKNGFRSDSLSFSLWEKAFTASAESIHFYQDIVFDMEGELNTEKFKDWAKRPEFVFLSGDTKLSGQLQIPTSAKSDLSGISLKLSSELEGLELDLPKPFYKESHALLELPAQVNIRYSDDEVHYEYLHGDLFSVDVWPSEKALPFVQLKIGSALSSENATKPNIIKPGVVEILGSLPAANYEEWTASIGRLIEASGALSSPGSDGPGVKIRADLRLGEFDFFDLLIPDLSIEIENREDFSWLISASSEMLNGQVELPGDDRPVSIDLDLLNIQLTEKSTNDENLSNSVGEESELPERISAFSNVDLEGIGELQVSVSDLRVDNVDWGSWSFITRPIDGGVLFDDFSATVRELRIGHTIPSQFYWIKQDDSHTSRFIGSVDTDDVGSALEAWDFERLMESESSSFRMDIAWNAEPDLIALPLLYGDVKLNIKNGSFLRGAEAGENPLLRLVALFNFDTLARRLRLDFSDLAAKGFAFDSVGSELYFDEGVALIQEPLMVESSSSKMRMVGAVDLINEEVDAELVVTLPVAGNLAVATAFAVGLPAGLGVYIISKMFDKHVDKVSSISYSVDGSWEDPKVKVRKVFDNKTRKKKQRTSNKDDPEDSSLNGQNVSPQESKAIHADAIELTELES